MHPDARRWNARYAKPNPQRSFEPDEVLRECEPQLPGPGLALDIACGVGGNALWLAAKGFRSVGVDLSEAGLRLAREEARRRSLTVHLVLADALRLPLAPGRFDLVVVTRFLERALLPRIRELLAPGGCVFYRTFNLRHRASRPSFNADFLLRDGELREAFRGLQVLVCNERPGDTRESSHILARRPPLSR